MCKFKDTHFGYANYVHPDYVFAGSYENECGNFDLKEK